MERKLIVAVLLIFAGADGANESVSVNGAEKRLYSQLLSDYDPRALPSPIVNATLGMDLQQIIQIDPKLQVVKVNAWLKYSWMDESLAWAASAFGGVEMALIPAAQLWRPDVQLYNSAHPDFDAAFKTDALVYSNGQVNWIPPAILTATAKMDNSRFPFEELDLSLKFGSWARSGLVLNLLAGHLETTTYSESPEWELVSSSAKRNAVHYECCAEPYIDVTFGLKVRRRSGHFVLTRLVPCVALAGLALLALCLPVGPRGPALAVLFLALLLCSGWAASGLPPSASPPRAALFLLSLLGTVAAALGLSFATGSWRSETGSVGGPGKGRLSKACGAGIAHVLRWAALVAFTLAFFLTTPDYTH